MERPQHFSAGIGSDTDRFIGIPGVRRMLHLYWSFARGMTLGVRGAVLDADNRVFLIRHTYTPGWHLPGGGVEPGESALESLGRELAEEACIASTEEPSLHGIFFNRLASSRDHVLVYVLRRFEVLAEKRPDREIAESGWFGLDALPPDASRPTRERLAEIAGQRPVAPDW